MRITVDRIENGIAVCQGENEEIYNILLRDIGFDINEGDTLDCELSDGIIRVKNVDKEYEAQKRKRINDLYMKLKYKSNEKRQNK